MVSRLFCFLFFRQQWRWWWWWWRRRPLKPTDPDWIFSLQLVLPVIGEAFSTRVATTVRHIHEGRDKKTDRQTDRQREREKPYSRRHHSSFLVAASR